MRFTMESEYNNCPSFLDVHVKRLINLFVTSVFLKKKTFSCGLGIGYFSNCCKKFKLGTITTLLNRAYVIYALVILIMHVEF